MADNNGRSVELRINLWHTMMKQLPANEAVIGIDLGDTIFHRERPGAPKHAFPDALEVIRDLVRHCKAVHIVSRVNAEQKIRNLQWLEEVRFHEVTALPRANVHFCAQRRDKAPICERLGITHFIDDRPEVVSWLRPQVIKILHRPNEANLAEYKDRLVNVTVVQNWDQIRRALLPSVG